MVVASPPVKIGRHDHVHPMSLREFEHAEVEADELTSKLLPGFSLPCRAVFDAAGEADE
jgi:hypothetical protein